MRPSGLLRSVMPSWVVRFAGKSQGRVALTFDDGPTPGVTERVIDAMRRRGHRATFFVLGKQAERYPEIVEQILASGSELGNHSYSHIRMPNGSLAEVVSDFAEADNVLRRLGGPSKALIRPPGGELTVAGLAYFVLRRRAPILWSILVPGEERRSAGEIVEILASSEVRGGDIILLHDEAQVGNAIEGVLDMLEARGLTSVTASELLWGRSAQ